MEDLVIEWDEDFEGEYRHQMYDVVQRFGVNYVITTWEHDHKSDIVTYKALKQEEFNRINMEGHK